MVEIVQEDNAQIRLRCPAELDVSCVARFYSVLRQALELNPRTMIIDAGDLRQVDTAVLQTFAVLVRALRARNIAFHWDGSTVALSDATRLLGLSQALELNL
jgi:anti-anti-sigma regulatory factor